MMYLSEHHDNLFMPATNDHRRGLALQWLFYLMSTFQPEVLIQFHAERYFPDNTAMQQALKSASLLELEKLWQVTRLRSTPDRIFSAKTTAFATCCS
jgi:glutathione S-transferase